MATTAKRIRVNGVSYDNPDEAYVAAEELEHHADTLAEQLRRNGKEGEADQVQDRGHANADKLRTWAREREADEADKTEQPADAPAAPPAARVSRRAPRRRARSGPAARRPSSRARFTPRSRSLASQTGIPAASSSATSLVLQVVGLTLGIAFLTLLLSRRGVQAFGGIAGGAAHVFDRIILPIDPLAPRSQLAQQQQGASLAATAAARRNLIARQRRRRAAPIPAVAGAVQ